MTITGATAIINLKNIRDNLAQIKKIAPHSQVMAICKANGYGHGLLEVAQSLNQADALGVARLEEAYTLKHGGIDKPIVLLEGFLLAADLAKIAANSIETVIHNEEQLIALETSHLTQPIQVWLKIDTGMTRIGILPGQVNEFYLRLKKCRNVKPEIRLMTHFACADEINADFNQIQYDLFQQIVTHSADLTSCPYSLANSAAILSNPDTHHDWIRPGIILYGISPLATSQPGFSPAMTLKSCLIAIKKITAGNKVGYGATYEVKQDTYVGVVAIGYGDGYPRHAVSGTPVWINGREAKLIGRVSMDMITIDLGHIKQDNIGDEVELWGENIAINRVADKAQTIGYELMCSLTARVKLSYKN